MNMDEQHKGQGDRADLMRRLQIGVLGLALVIGLASVAGFAIRKASDELPVTEELSAPEMADTQPSKIAPSSSVAPDAPLAELGVQPSNDAKPAAKTNAQPKP